MALAALAEEGLEEGGALGGENALGYGGAGMEGFAADVGGVAALLVGSSDNYARDLRPADCSGTHKAWLDGDV